MSHELWLRQAYKALVARGDHTLANTCSQASVAFAELQAEVTELRHAAGVSNQTIAALQAANERLKADFDTAKKLAEQFNDSLNAERAVKWSLAKENATLKSWQESTIEDLAIGKGKRVQYYDYAKYMRHKDDCKGGGDHCCPCGMSQVWMNIDQLLDSCEALAQSQPQPLGWEQS